MEDARHPVLHAQKIIQEEVERNGGDPLKLEPLPFSIPYDKYFQRPLAEVYAAVTNTSTNSSMVGIAERLLNHIREATNHSERIAYKLLIFGERREGVSGMFSQTMIICSLTSSYFRSFLLKMPIRYKFGSKDIRSFTWLMVYQ